MTIRPRAVFKAAAWSGAVLLLAACVAPFISGDRFGDRLRGSLERALGRRVEIGKVRFSLFTGPAFSVDSVVIHEDPAIGIEPSAYVRSMDVRPAWFPLLTGRFVIASIRLDDASINVAKSGAASEAGRWNFTSFVTPSLMHTVPAVHVRNGRVNFKFGDEKSIFYLTQTDFDISPPGSIGRGWNVYCSARLARTDRPALGLGSLTIGGHWYVEPERLDLNLDLDQTSLGELTALLRGQDGGVHGTVSARLHLAGPLDRVGIVGRLNVADIHRWDLLPPKGQGWPLDIRGRLDLLGQKLELESNSARDVPLPLSVRLRAFDYLSQPHWAIGVNWNHFPVGPLMQLARDMGAEIPAKLAMGGTMDGAIGYSGQGTFQGSLAFHDAALTIPDSPPVRFDDAYIVTDHGHVRLSPAVVRTADQDQAEIEADYAMDANTLDLSIVTGAMKVASLRAQVALAAVPWLEQVQAGRWSGELHYHREPAKAGWTGDLQLTDARIPMQGMSDPLQLAAAHARIEGARVALDRIEASAGKTAFTGEYSYEPGAARPHRFKLRAGELDAADLEAELMPTLHRGGLIARALGRSPVPDWMQQRGVEGTVQIGGLLVAGARVEGVRGRLLWDVAHVEVDGLQAKLDRAALTGKLTVNLRGSKPVYRLVGKVKGIDWQSGKLDAEGVVDATGSGTELLTNMKSEGTFSGSALDFGTPLSWLCVAGNYTLAWSQTAPHIRLTGLNLRNGDESYTGQGGLQDGRLVIQLTSGAREMRMSGPWARVRVEEGQ